MYNANDRTVDYLLNLNLMVAMSRGKKSSPSDLQFGLHFERGEAQTRSPTVSYDNGYQSGIAQTTNKQPSRSAVKIRPLERTS